MKIAHFPPLCPYPIFWRDSRTFLCWTASFLWYAFQEKAAKWKNPDGHMDGLTTNGVLVMHPRGGFTEESQPGVWREISVCGDVYTLRETRSAQQRGKLVSGLHTKKNAWNYKHITWTLSFFSPEIQNLCLGLRVVFHWPRRVGSFSENKKEMALFTIMIKLFQ